MTPAAINVTGRTVELMPLTPELYPVVYRLAHEPSVNPFWRSHGERQTYAEFEERLWHGVTAQVVAVARRSREPVAWLVAEGWGYVDGVVAMSVAVVPHRQRKLVGIEATALFCRYLFLSLPINRIVIQASAPAFAAYASTVGRGMLTHRGVMPSQHYANGQTHDVVLLSIERAQWEGPIEALLARLVKNSPDR